MGAFYVLKHGLPYLGEGGSVQRRGLQRGVVPTARVKAAQQDAERGDRLRGRKSAVPRAMDEQLAEHLLLACRVNHLRVSALVGGDDQAVTSRVHRKRWHAQVAVEADEAFEVRGRGVVGLDARARVQRAQVSLQVETRLGVKRLNFGVIG